MVLSFFLVSTGARGSYQKNGWKMMTGASRNLNVMKSRLCMMKMIMMKMISYQKNGWKSRLCMMLFSYQKNGTTWKSLALSQ